MMDLAVTCSYNSIILKTKCRYILIYLVVCSFFVFFRNSLNGREKRGIYPFNIVIKFLFNFFSKCP